MGANQAGLLREAALTWFRLATEARSDGERLECFRLAHLNAQSARAAEGHSRQGLTGQTDIRSMCHERQLWDKYQKALEALYDSTGPQARPDDSTGH